MTRSKTALLVCLYAVPLLAQDTARQAGWIVIPAAEYNSLHERAFPAPEEPESRIPEATLTRVDYDLKIDGSFASGRANPTVDVLRDGWVSVPIPAGLLVRDARLEGRALSLVPNSGKQLTAVLRNR